MSAHFDNPRWRIIVWVLLSSICFSSCGGSHEETISGVTVPVPRGLTRTTDEPAELSIFGVSTGSASFVGKPEVVDVVAFYKKEMAARGWRPHMNLLSGAAMLAYTKNGQSILISIDRHDNETRVTLTVSGLKP